MQVVLVSSLIKEYCMFCDVLQKSVDIGNEIPGLKISSLYVGGVQGEHNNVLQGFKGCIQVNIAKLHSTMTC